MDIDTVLPIRKLKERVGQVDHQRDRRVHLEVERVCHTGSADQSGGHPETEKIVSLIDDQVLAAKFHGSVGRSEKIPDCCGIVGHAGYVKYAALNVVFGVNVAKAGKCEGSVQYKKRFCKSRCQQGYCRRS